MGAPEPVYGYASPASNYNNTVGYLFSILSPPTTTKYESGYIIDPTQVIGPFMTTNGEVTLEMIGMTSNANGMNVSVTSKVKLPANLDMDNAIPAGNLQARVTNNTSGLSTGWVNVVVFWVINVNGSPGYNGLLQIPGGQSVLPTVSSGNKNVTVEFKWL